MGRIMMIVFNALRDGLFIKVGQNAVRSISVDVFRHLHNLSLRFHLERRTGELNRVVARASTAIELIIRMGVLNFFPTVLELVMVFVIFATMFGLEFVGVLFLTLVSYVFFTKKATDWRINIRREMNNADNEAGSRSVDSLLNYETIKYFGNEELETKRYDKVMAGYEKAAVRTFVSLGVLNAGQAAIFTIGLTIAMLIAANGVASKEFTLGDFVMINALLIQLQIPLNFLGMVYREIRQALVDLENLFTLLKKFPEIVDVPNAKPLEVKAGEVVFEDVHFAYDPKRPILKGVSFKVPAGKMTAIVGPSGAGKSTISRALFRFYNVTSGQVRIDGQDISQVTQKSLRAAIGMVPQDTVLFNETLYYNIAYGRPGASSKEVFEAAGMAQIDGFIKQLPEGYDTFVGERGLKLSGGEKQRVAIARTILKAPPILMLDEATSALDSYTEKEIQGALDQVSRERTTLVIAHRLSTVIHADEILVLDQGVIVERGRHEDLVAQGGVYAGLWQQQRESSEDRLREASTEPVIEDH
jgi:ATP-binding cassette subfamily B protein